MSNSTNNVPFITVNNVPFIVVERQKIEPHQYGAARQIYDRMIKSLSPGIKFWTTLDKHGGFKIGPYHFQEIEGIYSVHFERDIVRNPWGHTIYDVRIP